MNNSLALLMFEFAETKITDTSSSLTWFEWHTSLTNITKFLLIMFRNWNTFNVMFGIFDHKEFSVNVVLNYSCQNTQYKKQPRDIFGKKGVIKNFAKFKRKHLCQSLFFNKTAAFRTVTLLKKRLWPKKYLLSVAIRFSCFYSFFSFHIILNAL